MGNQNLPGGRAYYTGKNAYANQAFELDTRRQLQELQFQVLALQNALSTKFLSASASWTPGTVTQTAPVTVSVAVPGAEIGNQAAGAFSLVLDNDCIICAAVIATDTVRVTIAHFGGSPVTYGAGTVSVMVFK